MAKSKILYAEDEETIAFLTQDNLKPEYDVVHCDNGKSALEKFKNEDFDICLLDIMMPKMDGFELATKIRKFNSEVPIIFISAKTLKEDRIKGLKTGADDYLIKPFSIEELMLKIEIFLKRSQKTSAPSNTIYKIGNCEFDAKNYTVTCQNNTVSLTRREAELLI